MPEDDDEYFELDGDYFLSGIGNAFQVGDGIEPVRHGVDELYLIDGIVSLPFKK